jgi:hypothetical protein
MASIIRIKRSSTNGNPATLGAGELAYSALSGTIINGGDRLYIGMGTETNGNAANHVVIGGKYFTDMLDHATGTLTADSAVLVDTNKKIDEWNVDNLTLNGNTISSTDTNGNILLDPAGTGYVQLVGTNGVVIPVGTTAQRGPSVQGTIRYNTDTSSFEGYSGTVWGSLGGVKSVDGLTYIAAESSPGASDDTLHFYASNNASAVEVAQLDVTKLSVLQTTQSTSSTTGALVVAGGVGIAKNLNVGGDLSVAGAMEFTGGATFQGNLTLVGASTAATEYFKVQNSSGTDKFVVDSFSGNTSIAGTLGVTGATTLSSTLGVTGNTTVGGTLGVTGATTLSSVGVTGNATVGGTLGVTGEATFASATVSDLTSGRVVLAGTAGSLNDSANLTFNGSTLTVTGATSVSGNSSVGGNLSVTGTTALTGNVTASGTLGVTGATTLSSTLAVAGDLSVNSNKFTVASSTGNTAVAGTLTVTGAASFNSALNMNAQKITNLAEPTADSDAATKYYVDAARSGLDIKNSVRAATTANITLSNTQTIDGVALSVGDRVLVKNQNSAAQNGIYVVAAGSWTRSIDADQPAELNPGTFVFVEEGTVNSDTGFVVVSDGALTIGTDPIEWTLFSTSGTLVAGAGLSKNGYTLEVNTAANGGIEIAADNLQLKSSLAGAGLTYASGVLDIVGTANRITVNADSIDIASTYVGQTSITTLGTITTGTWQADVIQDAYIANDLTIVGGTINNTPIGATTRSTGAFTTLSANSTLGVTGATTLSSTLAVTGATTLSSTLAGTGATTLSSTLAVTGNITASANITGAGAATSTIDGFTIDGGTY